MSYTPRYRHSYPSRGGDISFLHRVQISHRSTNLSDG